MKKVLKIVSIAAFFLIAAFVVWFFAVAPQQIARSKNAVIAKPPYAVSDRAAKLHADLFVADLHADSLLWNYDLNQRRTWNISMSRERSTETWRFRPLPSSRRRRGR